MARGKMVDGWITVAVIPGETLERRPGPHRMVISLRMPLQIALGQHKDRQTIRHKHQHRDKQRILKGTMGEEQGHYRLSLIEGIQFIRAFIRVYWVHRLPSQLSSIARPRLRLSTPAVTHWQWIHKPSPSHPALSRHQGLEVSTISTQAQITKAWGQTERPIARIHMVGLEVVL